MPGGDRTGPMGMGPMSGKGAGFCNDSRLPWCAYPGGFGHGRGFRRMFQVTGLPGWRRFGYSFDQGAGEAVFNEKDFLKRQKDVLQEELKNLEKRLEDLKEETD